MKKSVPKTHVLNALIFVAQHTGQISVQEVADHVGLQKKTICLYIKNNMSISLTKFRQKFRIHLAASIIKCSSKNTKLSDIIPSVGITNLVTFAKYFRSEFGVNPRTWQKHHGATKKLPEKGSLSDQVLRSLVKQYFRS